MRRNPLRPKVCLDTACFFFFLYQAYVLLPMWKKRGFPSKEASVCPDFNVVSVCLVALPRAQDSSVCCCWPLRGWAPPGKRDVAQRLPFLWDVGGHGYRFFFDVPAINWRRIQPWSDLDYC